ncbi:hypothetical protein MOI43_004767 [Escherichia coli]|nr:hypothetical protein [Escherichia coli]EEV6167249.1 hypothetical protein [Escherichia coli]EEV8855627.1 hypothetical protein [Escherichia coli]EEW8776170.1 hypothetical protein [Escherichia coli]EEZ4313580.1 hypothetical protein [Escherichia coli]
MVRISPFIRWPNLVCHYICWLDLMTGNSLEDWTENLKRKSEKELEEWIINRQKQNAALTDLMDQYVLLAYRTTVDDNRN